MAGINWTASSINSFFKTSLNQSTNSMNNLYSMLGDRTLIKSGSYHKLMDAYVKKVNKEKESDTTSTSSKKETTTYDNKGTKNNKISTDSIIDTLI